MVPKNQNKNIMINTIITPKKNAAYEDIFYKYFL